jgi:uncharacterized protein
MLPGLHGACHGLAKPLSAHLGERGDACADLAGAQCPRGAAAGFDVEVVTPRFASHHHFGLGLRQQRPAEQLRLLMPNDLPQLARFPFAEADRSYGRVVLAFPKQGGSTWNGNDLLGMAAGLNRLELPDGTVVQSSGVPMAFAAMLRSIVRDGASATLLAFLWVVILVPLGLRSMRAGMMASATLLVGALWMVGTAGLWGGKIHFLNFVALPITVGVGAGFAVNLVARLPGCRSVRTAVTSTGGAVALCSWTTMVGYGSLLGAHHQPLQGLGAVAILGAIATLAAAAVLLPAALSRLPPRPRDGDR